MPSAIEPEDTRTNSSPARVSSAICSHQCRIADRFRPSAPDVINALPIFMTHLTGEQSLAIDTVNYFIGAGLLFRQSLDADHDVVA